MRVTALTLSGVFVLSSSMSFAPPTAADTLNLYLLIVSGHQYVDGDMVPPYPGTGPLAGYNQAQLSTLVQKICAAEAKNTPPPSPPPKQKGKSKPQPAAPAPVPCTPRNTDRLNRLVANIQQNKAQRVDLDKEMYQYQVVQPPDPPLKPTVPPKAKYSDDDRAAMCRIHDYDYRRFAGTLMDAVDAWKKGYKGIDIFNSSWIAAETDLYPEQAGLFAAQDLMLKDPHNTTGPQMRAVYDSTWRKIIGMPDDSYCQQNHIQGIG